MSKAISNHFSGTKGEGKALIKSLEGKGIKCNPNDVVVITQDSNGRIVWLEKGKSGANGSGLKHIVEKHEKEFAKQGISKKETPQYLMAAIKNGKIVGHQGRGKTRPIYEFTYKGKKRRVAITSGSNGYIVGANPASVPKEDKEWLTQ